MSGMQLTVMCPHCRKGSTAVLFNGDRVTFRHECVVQALGVRWQGMPGRPDFAVVVDQGGEWRRVEEDDPLYATVVHKLLAGANRFEMEFDPPRPVQ